MTDFRTFLRSIDYESCLAKRVKWTLEEAVDYLTAYQASKKQFSNRDEAYDEFLNIRKKLSVVVKQGINEGRLQIDQKYLDGSDSETDRNLCDLDFKKSLVVPFVLINWARQNNIELPKEFELYGGDEKNSQLTSIDRREIHRERSRAVAEVLWSMAPDITLSAMAQSKQIVQSGCEGCEYNVSIIKEWLADVKINKKYGGNRSGSGDSIIRYKKDKFPAAIKLVRTELGLSQGKFGAYIGVSAPNVSSWEKGKTFPSDRIMQKIILSYGIRPEFLDTAEGEIFTNNSY